MKLSETSFDEFIHWCTDNKPHWHTERQYVTVPKLRVIYAYYCKHNLKCKGRNCTVYKGNEWVSSYSQPLDHNPTRDDLVWNLFHEVWCKTEWAVRCGTSETALGYSSVKSEFGLPIIKALREV